MKKLLLLIIGLFIAGTAFSADEWLKSRPQSTDTRISWPADSQANNAAIDRLLSTYNKMLMSYSSGSTISVSAGSVVCSNAAGTVRRMRLNPSATNVTFSDIDTGSEASGTQYYLFANCDADAETATFKISASSTAPTGVTYYKRVGSFYNDSSSNITRLVNDDAKQVREKESKTAGSTYQALTDGFVTFTGCASSVRGQAGYIYTDNSSSPTTLYGQFGSGSDQGSGSAITIPVKAGDYYKTTFSSTDSCTATVYFIPFN
jgi:hypothetical protein